MKQLAEKRWPSRSLVRLAALGCALIAVLANAADLSTPRELPPTEQARAWIEKDPMVIEARRALDAAEPAAAALRAGSNEWVARVQGQRRHFRDSAFGSGSNSSEWLAQLERPIRVNGKAALDRDLGVIEIEVARARLGEARHEAARQLADLWMEEISARGQQALVAEQLAIAESNVAAVDRRRRAGDASALDANVARADLSEVERQVSLAATQVARSQAKLKIRFAEARPPTAALPDPSPPPLAEDQWRARVLAEADLIKTAEAEVRKAELTAERAKADRVPDPTVGVYTASEAFRNERVVGLSISMPLGGTYREQRTLQAVRLADTARAVLSRQRLQIEVEAAETYASAVGASARWQVSERGAVTARESARLMQRAYTLGEADLQALLLARRQAAEASRAALEARADALRLHHRLLIDAHLIWALEDD